MSGTDRTQSIRLTEVNLADAEGNLGNYGAQQELLEKALTIKDMLSACIPVAGVGRCYLLLLRFSCCSVTKSLSGQSGVSPGLAT